jgi:hypothetical protein
LLPVVEAARIERATTSTARSASRISANRCG